jgi:hypothetical protein
MWGERRTRQHLVTKHRQTGNSESEGMVNEREEALALNPVSGYGWEGDGTISIYPTDSGPGPEPR